MARLVLLVSLLATVFATGAQTRDRTLVVNPKEAVAGEARHALVVGNSAYASAPLRNPVNDARAMAKSLGEAGFNVTLLEDATQAALQRAIRSFGDRIANGGVGLFYYAGHGIQAKGRNYLIPVNAEIEREYEIDFAAVDVNLVLAMMDSAKNALNIVILDACRNNPFARNFRSMQTGLAQMDAPTGTFIAFATAPGSVAADGAGENGVYTKHLLAEMTKPGVPIELMFKQVRNGVMMETKGEQIPWESSSVRGEFAFRPGAQQASVADAIAEALKREREVQQLELQKLQAALERQRKQLEELGLRPVEQPKPAAAPAAAPAPLVTASAAPASIAATLASTRMPRQGDTWTYRLSEPGGAGGMKQRDYRVKILAASESAILEQYSIDHAPSKEWAHSAGSYVVALGKSLFAPYLPAFTDLSPATPLGRLQIADGACTGNYACRASARVVGKEDVKVPAGLFQAFKVEVEQSWWPVYALYSQQLNGGRKLTVWYAPAIKRAIKFSSRATFGDVPPIDTNFDLELVSYKLN